MACSLIFLGFSAVGPPSTHGSADKAAILEYPFDPDRPTWSILVRFMGLPGAPYPAP
jgi:hypothetical protein